MRYSAKQYARALVELVKENGSKNLDSFFKKFIETISKNGDISLKNEILFYFDKYLDESMEVARLEVTSATNKFPDLPEKINGKKVEINKKIDPGILGGVQIKIGDILIDNSVKGRLKQLKESIC